eukprot:NODE_758_length_4503_cov_0.443460.p1 type:complete len:278 gc:universal NODE_758_length_4503_cov_0.443460:1541-2374(+)
MLIKIGSQEFSPEYVEGNDEVWRITDKLLVERGDKSHQLENTDYGERVYMGNDIKIFYCKPVKKEKVDLTALKEYKKTVKDNVNNLQLSTCQQVEYIGIPNTDAATPLDEMYYRDMHVFSVFKSDLLSGACIGIEQVTKSLEADDFLDKSFRICHFFVLKPFQGLGIGRLLYSTVKSWVNDRFKKLCVEDPNELFSNLRDHCDLIEFKKYGGLMALKNKNNSTSTNIKKAKLDPIAFVGKYVGIRHFIQKLEKELHLSPVNDYLRRTKPLGCTKWEY